MLTSHPYYLGGKENILGIFLEFSHNIWFHWLHFIVPRVFVQNNEEVTRG